MFRKYSVRLLLFAAAIDLVNMLGWDPNNIFLLMFNPVSWFIEIFKGISIPVKFALFYATNLVFWFLVGFYIDWLIERRQKKRA